MTDQHPITPPSELIGDWITEAADLHLPVPYEYIATRAARWGADQEMEAWLYALCLELRARIEALEAAQHAHVDTSHLTKAEREQILEELARPATFAELLMPPTLNSIALQMLGTIKRDNRYIPEVTDTIRRALEALPND